MKGSREVHFVIGEADKMLKKCKFSPSKSLFPTEVHFPMGGESSERTPATAFRMCISRSSRVQLSEPCLAVRGTNDSLAQFMCLGSVKISSVPLDGCRMVFKTALKP